MMEYSLKFDYWCSFYDPEKIELRTVLENAFLKGKIACEIGCGTGRFTFQIAQYLKHCIALDIDSRMINYCKRKLENFPNLKKKISFIIADANSLPFKNESFDILFDIWTFSSASKNGIHLANEYYRVLKKGGKLICIEEGERSEYQEILLEFIPEDYLYSVKDVIEEPLSKVFGKAEKRIELKIPYIFPSIEVAYEIMLFDLEKWKRIRLTSAQKRKLMERISKFKRRKIMESAIFYLFRK